jgi:hypothetical protein
LAKRQFLLRAHLLKIGQLVASRAIRWWSLKCSVHSKI